MVRAIQSVLGLARILPLIAAYSVAVTPTGRVLFADDTDATRPAVVADDHPARMREGLELFRGTVRDVLVNHCLACHGGAETKGELDLATRESLVASGFVAETAADSHLISVVRHEADPHMPKDKPRLDDEGLTALARWIDLGAPYDGPLVADVGTSQPARVAQHDESPLHWSFRPLSVVAPPLVIDESWPLTAIDRFVLARLEAEGLRPNPPAQRPTLIRRLYATLVGLPPNPDEIDAFLADRDPQAYERLVDRLLASPHYGERWARHWMDVARFAESHGYEQDYDRPYAFAYRDFLIRAFNDDLPYDRFVSWQLAGDELAPEDPQALAATGFLGAGAFPTQLTEAEFERARYDELDDMVGTFGTAMLGLSVGCARCHNHKFDPIAAEDYYRLAANFATTIRSEIDIPSDRGPDATEKIQITAEGYPPVKHHADDRGFPHFYPEVHILKRGDVEQRLQRAEPGFLPALSRRGRVAADWCVTPPAGWTRSRFHRAALAHWLVDSQDGAGHLAARVIVNRLWQHQLGTGLVATPNDFGKQGAAPTHPELLDWLAADLIHHGWQLKRIQRLIVTSRMFQQSSSSDESRMAVDSNNQRLWRWTPRRLEGEALRDSMLSAAGLLDPTMYGPGTLDPKMRRRSVYFFIKRSQLVPFMMLYDWPEHLVSIGRRGVTTIAPQALAMLNDPTVRDSAAALAEQALAAGSTNAVPTAYRQVLGREPSESESRQAEAFREAQRAAYADGVRNDPSDVQKNPERLALADLCQALLASSEFQYIP